MAHKEVVIDGSRLCPRCGNAFECKVDDLKHCDCIAVRLPAPILETLESEFPDCLCPACLREIASESAHD